MSYLSNWKKETSSNTINKIFLFIVSPILSLILSLKEINTRSSFIVIFLFYLCFGMAFTVSNNRDADNKIDGVSYRANFERYRITNEIEYYYGLKDFLSFEGENKDYYFDTVAFYVSRITDNYHVMFFVFSIVFAFFQLKCLKYLVLNKYFTVSALNMLLVLLFTWNQIFNINGMRFWTAAWIGVLCMFKIFYEKKNSYFLLALTTPFFHGSFWIFLIVICIAKLFSHFEKSWIALFIISIIASNILLEFVQGYSGFIPSFIENEVLYYTDSYYVKDTFEGTGTGFWILDKIFGIISKAYINILIIILIINKKKVSLNQQDIRLYRLLIVWATFANFGMSIPSLGNRFIIMAYSLIAFLWLTFFKGEKYNWVIYLFPIAFFMSIYHQINLYDKVTDFLFYISSPFVLIPQYLF